MKTKKRFNFRKICYLMLVLSVLGGISMSYCFGNELKENNVKNAKKIVKSSACVGRAYFEEIIKERISGLELLAGKLSNTDEVTEVRCHQHAKILKDILMMFHLWAQTVSDFMATVSIRR